MLSTDLSLVDLERSIRRYVDDLGLELPGVVKRTFRLIMRDVNSITAPKTNAQGRKAVARDVNRAIYLLDPDKVTSIAVRNAILKKDYSLIEKLFKRKKSGKWSQMKVVPFSGQHHANVRDARGRVQRPKLVATPDKTEHRMYIKRIQGHVGHLRSGWMKGLREAGLNVPTWISRHSGGEGTISVKLAAMNPVISTTHNDKNSALSRRLVNSTIEKRAKTMQRDVDQVLRGRTSRYFS
jgi:hypothetical protein